jgi:hypothetical protein
MKPPATLGLTIGPSATQGNLQSTVEQTARRMMGNLSFGIAPGLVFGDATTNTVANQDPTNNMDRYIATGTVGAPGVPFTVQHNLRRIPIGLIVIRLNQVDTLVDSGVAWTAATSTSLGTISLIAENGGGTKFTIIIV